jgi:alpha-beta hydrolase superfamily lysophospholipase
MFINGNITKWSKEIKITIKRIVNKNNFILIGSSMGAWLSLNQFKNFKTQIKGFLGIGSAPEFLENLIWKKFTEKMKKEIIIKGIYHLKHGDYEYPITYQLIKDGRKNKVLNKKLYTKIDVTMIHGGKDEVVPVIYSRKVLRMFTKAKKKLIIIKNGNHSLSNKLSLKRINVELNKIVSDVI